MTTLTAVVTIFFVFILTGIAGRILLYDSENDPTVEKFDCIYYMHNDGEDTPYCRRFTEEISLNRTERICDNEGRLSYFRELIMQNVLPGDILEWSSSIEKADLYARFFYNQSSIEDANDTFLCNCTKPGTFGKYCEYQLTHDTELVNDAIKAQFQQKQNGDSWNTQKYGNILCYTTLACDSGMMCLDWRDISDGTQQCLHGFDEENSDKLEFNECEDNEFRCTNGMCIAEEFWLDGHADCMDWSDELNQGSGESCSFTPNTMECDEHICPQNEFSCGDGQCIDRMTRMAFQRFVPAQDDCFNKRNLNHMCEVSPHRRAWTLPNGLCWPDEGDKNFQFFPSNAIAWSNLTDIDKCRYLLRCFLSDGLSPDCPCNLANCSKMMMDICPSNSLILYPSSGLINPNVLFYYKYDRPDHSPTIGGLILRGSQRCRGYQLTLNEPIQRRFSIGALMSNNILCLLDSSIGYKDNSSSFQYDKFCYNDSFTFNGRPYAVNPNICGSTGKCISQYRINDGFRDCVTGDDEYSNLDKNYCTGKVGQHRFQCYNDENKCLPVASLNSMQSDCSNSYDEIFFIENIKCQKSDTVDCNRLKEYIRQSPIKNESLFVPSQQQTSIDQISFRSYCDSFWNLQDHSDEQVPSCQKYWVCQSHQYQCLSGQCIDLDWVCDGEWDCTDASDEEGIFLIEQWSAHNSRLVLLNSVLSKCQKRYSATAFSTICNTSSELGCYLSNVLNPLDIMNNRPCINLAQIGDGVEDCYNAYDEKNTFETNLNSGQMLGFHLRCGNHSEPYSSACRPEAKNNCSKILCSNHRSEDNSCSGINDVICLNGMCIENGRCDEIFDCPNGEDEYWCAPFSFGNLIEYRYGKKNIKKYSSSYYIPHFPSVKIQINGQKELEKPIAISRNEYFPIEHSYQCNQGVAVLRMNETVCLCPPGYYGNRCEFFSDRISIIAQIDQKIFLKNTLKIRAKLLFTDKIIDDHEFTINPTIESLKKIKHKFYLLYSRSNQMLTHKRWRYFNRTDIVNNHPYSVHFDAFLLENDNSMKELGSWRYPIYFDYLPAYRLAVVLKFPSWFLNNTSDICSQNSCNQNSVCMPIFNEDNLYYCSCKSGYYGKGCTMYDLLCDSYCSPNALCRSGADQLKSSISKPYCICPLNHFGPRCSLEHHECDSNPCFNNGTCFIKDDRSGEASYMCLCSKRFYGDRCQYAMGSVHVKLNMTNTSSIQAAVVQLYDIHTSSLQLIMRHRQVYQAIPSRINYYHSDIYVPSLGLLKIYANLTSPQYFIMYSSAQTMVINITSSPEHCPHASSLLPEIWNANQSIQSVFLFHTICRTDTQRLCFHNEIYLCLCQSDQYRAECFNHNIQIDRCNNCLSDGKCIQGDLNDPNDFICICPPDYYGHRCEFHSQTFNSTTNAFLNSTSNAFRSSTSSAFLNSTSSAYLNSTSKAMQISYASLVFLFSIIGFSYNY